MSGAVRAANRLCSCIDSFMAYERHTSSGASAPRSDVVMLSGVSVRNCEQKNAVRAAAPRAAAASHAVALTITSLRHVLRAVSFKNIGAS